MTLYSTDKLSNAPDSLAYRLPPQDLEAEQCVLGSVLLENNAIFEVIDIIKSDDFYREGHRKIFDAINALTDKNEPVDIITLQDELKRQGSFDAVGGSAYLGELLAMVPTAANAAFYARIVKSKSLERHLLGACTTVVNDIYNSGMDTDQLLDSAETKIFEVTGSGIKRPYVMLKDIIKDSFKKIDELYKNGGELVGVPTGYKDLDFTLKGMRRGNLIVVAARPSVGKTALALNFVRNSSIRHGSVSVIFSLEMSKEEVLGRFISSEARVDFGRYQTGKIEEHEWANLSRAADGLSRASIFIDDTSPITPAEIRAKCRRIKTQMGRLDIVVVDYIQIMRSGLSANKNVNREQEISEISRTLKSIAKELEVPVIAISQLNREVDKRNNKRPWLSDLRESGAIEQDADIIMFIYRDDLYNQESESKGIAEIIIAKHRNGPVGTVKLAWLGRYTAFENYAGDDYETDFGGDVE
jgi:replicative DNA helicase